MKIYDKCPGCDESVLGRKPVTMFECRSWIGLDGVLTETNTCLRRQLARLQGIVDGEKLRITQAIASFSASTQEGFMTKPFDKPVSLPDCLLRGREAMAIVDKLPPIVKAVMERREYHECWEGDYDSADGPGDCGNWPTCPEECPLKQLLLIAGFEPREDGSTREAAESAKPPAKQPSAHPRTRP